MTHITVMVGGHILIMFPYRSFKRQRFNSVELVCTTLLLMQELVVRVIRLQGIQLASANNFRPPNSPCNSDVTLSTMSRSG